jgi:hypothetical protein
VDIPAIFQAKVTQNFEKSQILKNLGASILKGCVHSIRLLHIKLVTISLHTKFIRSIIGTRKNKSTDS